LSQSSNQFTSSDVEFNVEINIQKFVTPPVVEIKNISFSDENDNGTIDSFESSGLIFQVINSGPGPALGMVANVVLSGSTEGIEYKKSLDIPAVDPGDEIEFEIPLTSNRFTTNGLLQIDVNIVEPNDFSPPPFSVEIETRGFNAPKLEVVDFSVSENIWSPRKMVRLDVLLQNTGHSKAENIRANLTLPNLISCFSGNISSRIAELAPSDTFLLKYDIGIPNNYNQGDIGVSLDVTEKYGDYGGSWSQEFPFDEESTRGQVISIDASNTNDPAAIIRASLTANAAVIRIRIDTTLTKEILKVAVIEKDGVLCDGTRSSGQSSAEIIQGELIGLYSVVERKYLETILDEQKLAASGLVFEDADLAKAGCLAGAQGTVLVSYGCHKQKTKLQMTLVDCSTSDIYWSATSIGVSVDEYELLDAIKSRLKK